MSAGASACACCISNGYKDQFTQRLTYPISPPHTHGGNAESRMLMPSILCFVFFCSDLLRLTARKCSVRWTCPVWQVQQILSRMETPQAVNDGGMFMLKR